MVKKLIFIVVLFLGLFNTNAQNEDNEWERIKSLKTAFITQELNLKNDVAQKFWPVYNEYEEARNELYHKEHKKIQNIGCITQKEATNYLEELVNLEKKDYELKKEYFSDLKQIISVQEIVKLIQLEDDFHRKLIREFRSRKEKEKSDNKNNK
ncbi:hypothetical protein [Zunongwangia sp.]|uniref:hypothetical protein n=1 Tax=Zunongwangia sp. TaxID=1965325 RepID=UPI003AA8D743